MLHQKSVVVVACVRYQQFVYLQDLRRSKAPYQCASCVSRDSYTDKTCLRGLFHQIHTVVNYIA